MNNAVEYTVVDGYPCTLYEAAQRAKCKAKRQYQSPTVALNAGWLLGSKSRLRTAVYQCQWCKHFHLSKQTERSDAIVCTVL